MPVECICPVCLKPFSVPPSRLKGVKTIVCSKDCYNTMFSKKVLCRCLFCGKEFTLPPARIRSGGGKYCSNICKHADRTTSAEKRCEVCGEPIKVNPSRPQKRFCSYACRGKAMRGEAHPQYKQEKISTYGYIYDRKASEYWFEHRKIAEQIMGRKLESGEIIHHIDGDRRNNCVENLMYFPTISAHLLFHSGKGEPGIPLKEMMQHEDRQLALTGI